MITVEVFDKLDVENRQFTNKDTGEVTDRFKQKAYISTGGRFPLEFKLPIESRADAYEPGKYTLSGECFQVGKYGDLELNRFNIVLVPQLEQDAFGHDKKPVTKLDKAV
ncbi:G5P family DNA-binding protein [Agarivorans litoreus]|uniref:G5P family DNA-binding protein n=1 Tax=Agarivorans litoreus TaxID=1510455 RepID=UPI001C7E06F4|nr:G5P family DNA-binding protein [Agarivorans litoreus]